MDDANKGPPKILNFILPNGNTYIEFKRDKKSFDEVIYKSLHNATNDTLMQQHKEDSVVSIVATVNEDTITYQWESMQKSVTLPNIDIFKKEYIDIIGLWGTLLYYGIYFTVLYNKSKQNKGVSKNAICMIFMEPMGNGKTFDIQIYQKNVPDVEYLRSNHISLASNLINDQHKIEHFTIDSSEQLDIHLDLSRPIQQDMFIRKVGRVTLPSTPITSNARAPLPLPSPQRKPQEANAAGAKQHQSLTAGDSVEARFEDGKAWYNGTIRNVRVDGTFDIEYADGDMEEGVSPDLVRAISTSGGAVHTGQRGGRFVMVGGRKRYLRK